MTHTSHQTVSEEEATSISFQLGDKDWGDHFIVDLYFDTRYGSIVFNTLEGSRSKCPTEPNTAAVELPQLNLISGASPYIFPDQPIVFEMAISNDGLDNAELLLEADQGRGNLGVTIDGRRVSELGIPFTVGLKATKAKQIAITRGPLLYRYDPVVLTLKTCFGDVKDTAQKGKTIDKTYQLYNTMDQNQKNVLEFIKPCPKIQWAGKLAQNKNFLINIQSENKEYIPVMIFNQEKIAGKLYERTEIDRLENVWFRYRKSGDAEWFTGMAIMDTASRDLVPMNFIAENLESDYGYLTMNWYLGSLPDGKYEIVVDSQCKDVGMF